jgi:hypothetical protein
VEVEDETLMGFSENGEGLRRRVLELGPRGDDMNVLVIASRISNFTIALQKSMNVGRSAKDA